MRRFRHVLVAVGAAAALAVVVTAGANADSAGTISCSLVGGGTLSFAPSGDYVLAPNETISCTISGATAPSDGGNATTVYVKHGDTPTSSSYPMSGGNELVPASYANGVVAFTYSTRGLSTCYTAALSYNAPSGAVSNSKGAGSTFDFNSFCNTPARVGADLTASSTGDPSYTRTYGWSIAKTVDGPSLIEKTGGGTGSFGYTVTVTHDAGTDSAWQVNGSITVANPNDWESVTANVSEAVDNGGTCTVSDGGSVTLAPSASATLSYQCAYASAPSSATGTASATVSWDASAAATPDSSASASAPIVFGDPTTVVNGSTDVNDTLEGALGTLTAADPSSTSYSYTLAFPVPTSNCATYSNTASLSVGGSASAAVELCGPAATGALSQGYWSNKNGSAIISGSAATGGVCNLGTWLRHFAPFADLSSTASCSAVNTYVQSVISSATAKGAAMNPMLKSQMLAVALDVYFSDPSLGGNKIGAPAPIGSSWNVDLTHLVSGENVTGGFGGASQMTVLQMLTYAASQSNAGGSSWYGQVKATQSFAKDAFDAICNGQVYAP